MRIDHYSKNEQTSEGSSRGSRSRPGLSSGFSTRDFSIDQSVNLMDLRAEGTEDGGRAPPSHTASGGLTGLFRTHAGRNDPPARNHNDSTTFDYEYGDADAMGADAEEFVDPKRRKYFGVNPLRALCRPAGAKTMLTITMGLTAFLLVLSSLHSFETTERQQPNNDQNSNSNNLPDNAITNSNMTNVGTQLDSYVATNDAANNNVVLEGGYTKKRYNEVQQAIVAGGVTPKASFDQGKSSPQQSALDWLVFEDAAFLAADDEALLDRYGLAVLYFATNPSAKAGGKVHWEQSDGWMSEHGICIWVGIECPPIEQEATKSNNYEPFTKQYDANGKVVSIVLNKNGLHGTIPDEMGTAFSELVTLSMDDNALEGTLPAGMREARKLKNLMVSKNKITGTIPADYVTLRELHNLGLSQNNLVGPVWHDEWSTGLTKLRSYSASHNELTGTLPNFSKMIRMNALYLSANKLTGSIPTTISSMTSLLELKLNDNQLTGGLEYISGLSNLEVVHVSNNQLSGTIPDMFDRVFRLHDMMVDRNKLTGTIPNTLTYLQTLRTLDLSGNQLSGALPPGLGLLTDVVTVTLSRNRLEGTIPTLLGKLDDIKTLQLDSNQLNGPIPTELGGCFRLQTLHLHSNELEGSIPSELGGLSILSSLRLESNNLDESTEMPPQVCALRDDVLSVLVSDCNEKVSCDCCTECP